MRTDPKADLRRQASDRAGSLNRLELTGAEVDEQERYKKIAMDPDRDGWTFVESHESAPEEMVLDLDATGSMASRKAASFTVTTATTVISRCTSSRGSICCAPGCGVPISMGPRDRWRNWNGSDSAELAGGLDRHPGRLGLLPGDLIRWCEDHHVDYVMGLANNDRLKSESAEAMTQAEAEFNATGRPARVFKDFRYRTRHSWTSERRVVGKAEFLEKGANPRFVVTSLSPERLGARALYEDFYCARGDMENRIKEQQLGLFADRTSAATMRANQLRLYLSSAAYMLMHALTRPPSITKWLAHNPQTPSHEVKALESRRESRRNDSETTRSQDGESCRCSRQCMNNPGSRTRSYRKAPSALKQPDSSHREAYKAPRRIVWIHGIQIGSVSSVRKEVIQPQVLLQLPCYDFTPIMNHTVGACAPCGFAQRLLVQPTFVM